MWYNLYDLRCNRSKLSAVPKSNLQIHGHADHHLQKEKGVGMQHVFLPTLG